MPLSYDAIIAGCAVSVLITGGAILYISMSIETRLARFEIHLNEIYVQRLEWLVSQAAEAARITRIERRQDKQELNDNK